MYSSFPNAWGFGGLVGAEPGAGEIRAVLNDLRAHCALGVRVRPNPLQHAAWAAGRPAGVTALERRAHAIDLSQGFEDVWTNGFSGRARNHVRRAERAGLTVEVDSTGRLVPVFYDLFVRSVERWASKQNEPLALARLRARRRDPLEKLQHMIADLDGAARLWMAYSGERPAAAILVLRGANAQYTRGVMDVEVAGPTRANYLLHRLAIEDACRSGCGTYQMGETGASRSLAQFKESLGAQPHDYAEYMSERVPFSAVGRGARTVAKRILGFRDHD
jgi:lipid II:glycine glycyltransferase (peptidoglycan interpeptide bridge formation enzyme)